MECSSEGMLVLQLQWGGSALRKESQAALINEGVDRRWRFWRRVRRRVPYNASASGLAFLIHAPLCVLSALYHPELSSLSLSLSFFLSFLLHPCLRINELSLMVIWVLYIPVWSTFCKIPSDVWKCSK